MRILYIVNDLAYFRAHRENIACAMAQEGHSVNVAAGDWENVDISDWPSNMSLHRLELDKHTLKLSSDLKLIWALRSLMHTFEPDIVHAITIKPILMSALAVRLFLANKIRSKTKFVWTFPGLGKIFEATNTAALRIRKKLVVQALKFCARKCDVSVTFENPSDRDVIVQHQIVPQNQTHVLWGAGLALEDYKSIRSNRGDDPLVFLMATRLIREKGVDSYLETAAEYSKHPTQPKFLLAGVQDPSNPDNVDMSDIEAAENAGYIEFLGAVAGKDMPAVYNRSDVVCLPTRLREGFPRSLLEAAACGCALIASDQPAIRQLVKQDETGWLLPNASANELKQIIEKTLKLPDATRKTGEKTAEFVQSLPVSNESISKEFKKIYGVQPQSGNSDNREL